MAVTRNFLKGMGLTEEQVSAIIDEHVNTVNGLKDQRDSYKKDADQLAAVQQELDELKAKGDDGWQKKYEDEHTAFDTYKREQQEKESNAAKTSAYRGLLKDAGVSEKLIDLVVKASAEEIAKITLDAGKIKDAEGITKTVKETYKDYIKDTKDTGASTQNPPGNGTASAFDKMSLSDKMLYANEHPEAEEVKTWLKS